MNSTHPQRSDFGLRSLRRQQWVKWVQLVNVVVWSLFPPFYSPMKADWVPSSTDQMVPVWDGNGEEPAGGADFGDSDLDGLVNWFEEWLVTSPGNPDTDYDGLSDSFEFLTSGTSPLTWDSNSDGVSDHDAYYQDYSVNHNTSGFGVSVYDWDGDGNYNPDDGWPFDPYNGNGPPWVDSDGDSIPDHEDAWPNDPSNGEGNGGGGEGNPEMDTDGDGSPDSVDTHPGDAGRWSDHNGNGFNDWEDTPYNTDTDSDGYFDGNDSDPSDATLWNDHSPRNGINDQDEPPPGGGYDPMSTDSDGDGRVDYSDSHPGNEDLWSDTDDDGLNAEDEQVLGTSPFHRDSDSDGLTDGEEVQYQTDPLLADMDGDGLTDGEEMLGSFGSSPKDKFSLSRAHGWGEAYTDWQMADLTDTDGDSIPDQIEDLYAPYLNRNNAEDVAWDADGDTVSNLVAYQNGWAVRAYVTPIDRDGDGIEDVVEDLYPGILDKFKFADAVEDSDGDDFMNWQEVAMPGFHPGNAQSRYSGVADRVSWHWLQLKTDIETYQGSAGSTPWNELTYLSRLPESYSDQLSHWISTADANSNGVPDGLEAFLTDVAPVYLPTPGRVAAADYDGDGLPDVWEWKFRADMDPLDATDAGDLQTAGEPLPPIIEPQQSEARFLDSTDQFMQHLFDDAHAIWVGQVSTREGIDPDGDGLSNRTEFALSSHPLIRDSDGDGFTDGEEALHGGNPNHGGVQPALQLTLTSGATLAATVGAVADEVVEVKVTQAGKFVSNRSVTFSVPLPAGQISRVGHNDWQGAAVAVTDIYGRASVQWRAPQEVGSYGLSTSIVGSPQTALSVTLMAMPAPASVPTGPVEPGNPINGSTPGAGTLTEGVTLWHRVPNMDPQLDEKYPDKFTEDDTNHQQTGCACGCGCDCTTANSCCGGYPNYDYTGDNPDEEEALRMSNAHEWEKVTPNPGVVVAGKNETVSGTFKVEGGEGQASVLILRYERAIPPPTKRYPASAYPKKTNACECTCRPGPLPGSDPNEVPAPEWELTSTETQHPNYGASFTEAVSGSETMEKKSVLLQAEVKRDEDVADGNWKSIQGQNGKALPGQLVNLRVEPPSGTAAANFEWILPGKVFKEYSPCSELTELQEIESDDLKQQEVHFYWADTGSMQVKVTFTLDGKNIEVPVTINVEKPTATLAATGGASDIGASEFNPAFTLLRLSPGVTFAESVSIPSSYGGQGEWSFEQLVTPNCAAVRYDGSILRQETGRYHDGGPYPYAGPFPTGTSNTTLDAPSLPLKSEYNEATADMVFDMYLMFKPPGTASREVPLRRLHWSWKDKAQYDQSTFEWKKVHIQGVQKNDSVEESAHPEWSDSSDQHIILK